MFERRAKRFLNMIKTHNQLLFVRINPINCDTSEDEINNFTLSIHSINPNLDIKFLLIHTVENSNSKQLNESKIYKNIKFFQKEFLLEDCPDVYLQGNVKIQQLFIDYLNDIDLSTSYIL